MRRTNAQPQAIRDDDAISVNNVADCSELVWNRARAYSGTATTETRRSRNCGRGEEFRSADKVRPPGSDPRDTRFAQTPEKQSRLPRRRPIWRRTTKR